MKYKIHFLFLLFFILGFGCIDSLTKSTTPSYINYDDFTNSGELSSMLGSVESSNKIIKSGSISIEVPQNTIESKYDSLILKLNNKNIEIVDLSYYEYTNEKRYAIKIKVLPEEFESVVSEIKSLGTIKSTDVSVEDITEKYVDVQMKISQKEIQLGRLYELYNKTETVSEILELEKEISRVEYELESLQRSLINYDKKVDKSTILIYLVEKKFEGESNIFDTLKNLIPIFIDMFSYGLIFVVGIIGFGIPLAIIYFIIKFLFFRK